jgi:hypothetical protein
MPLQRQLEPHSLVMPVEGVAKELPGLFEKVALGKVI